MALVGIVTEKYLYLDLPQIPLFLGADPNRLTSDNRRTRFAEDAAPGDCCF